MRDSEAEEKFIAASDISITIPDLEIADPFDLGRFRDGAGVPKGCLHQLAITSTLWPTRSPANAGKVTAGNSLAPERLSPRVVRHFLAMRVCAHPFECHDADGKGLR